jgi:hypothetical protein
MLIRFSPQTALGGAPPRLRHAQPHRQRGSFIKSLPAVELTLFAAIGLLLVLA